MLDNLWDNIAGWVREYPLTFVLFVATGAAFIVFGAYPVIWTEWSLRFGEGKREMMAVSEKSNWSVTYDSPKTDADGMAEDKRIIEIVDDVGQTVFRDHWLNGGTELTKGVANMSTVQCWHSKERTLDRACVNMLMSTGASFDDVRIGFGRDSCWQEVKDPANAAMKAMVPMLSCMKAIQPDVALASLAVNRLKISLSPKCWRDGGVLHDDCKRYLSRFRIAIARVDLKAVRSWKDPYTYARSYFADGYLRAEAFDRERGDEPLASARFYYDNNTELDMKAQLKSMFKVAAVEAVDSVRDQYIDDHTSYRQNPLSMWLDDSATVSQEKKVLDENPRYEAQSLQALVDRVGTNAAIAGNKPLGILYSLGWFWSLFMLALLLLMFRLVPAWAFIGSFVALVLFDYYGNVGVMFTICTIVVFGVVLAMFAGLVGFDGGGGGGKGHKPAAKPAAAHGGGGHPH